MTPQRIQRKRTKGWRMPEGAVYVGRPTKWGNPFDLVGAREMGYIGTDAELRRFCADLYRKWLRDPMGTWSAGTWKADIIRQDVRELQGRDLCCWCPLDDACHADVLLEVANGKVPA